MLDYLRLFLQLVFLISMMYTLLDCKEKLKKNRYKIGMFAIAVIICDALVFHRLGYTRFLSLYPLLVHLPMFLAFSYVSEFKLIKVLFVHLTATTITLSITVLGLFVAYYFSLSKAAVNIICYISYLPVWYLVYRYLRPTLLYTLRSTDKGWIGFCIIPFAYTLLIYSISTFNLEAVEAEPITLNVVFYFILAFASHYMILRYFRLNREQLTLQNEQDLLKSQALAAQTHLEALKESQEKTIIYRHDLRHHMHYLNTCIAENHLEEAQAYIAKINSDVEAAQVVQYCENATVNLLLSAYAALAKNNDINIEIHSVVPAEISMHPTDICVILGNGIENAIRACVKIEDVFSRSISVVCRHENKKLMLEICNTFLGEIRFEGEIPVSTEENHGLGVKSIVAAVQKYHGLYSFTAENSIFTMRVILQ